jgi:radical SAM superfamily enzyme YgiQ (UPF0313 family)
LKSTIKIWLADLTYTQHGISSDVMPAAVGCIASYAQKHLNGEADIRIFKFPEKLIAALENEPLPHVLGFSNYAWNRDLGSEFARAVKAHHPEIITVMGGPNYPTDLKEQEEFVRRHSMIDFFIVREGERPFAKLVEALRDCAFKPEDVPLNLASIHRILPDGSFYASEVGERIMNLSEIPSPYLNGLMDEYFDGVMMPIVQTNRGCPFLCTFCVEGEKYYTRVSKTQNRKIHEELVYIAEHMASLRETGKARSDLRIADSNFGMYKEDLEICHTIAEMQEKHGYPEYVSVATGKNRKEMVLEAAKIINGALHLSGSVQSLDKSVLANIKRDNISEQAIMDMALASSEIGANNYSEIILGLPGDTREGHLKSIQKMVEMDFNTICLYQLMLLPGTDLATRKSVNQWKIKSQFRVLPRCFGHFDIFGKEINAAEIEEICTENNSLTFEDYLDCRRMHLIVNLFHNDGVFKEVLRLLGSLGLSKFVWLEKINHFRNNKRFNNLVKEFLNETTNELWEQEESLRQFIRERKNIKKYIDGSLGANLIFKYKSLSMIKYSSELAEVAKATLSDYLSEVGAKSDTEKIGIELIEYARLRMTDIFENLEKVHEGTFNFDVAQYSQDVKPNTVEAYKLPKPINYIFSLSPDQQKTTLDFLAVYGKSIMGLTRIVAKVYVGKMFRSAKIVEDGILTPLNSPLLDKQPLTSVGSDF